MKWTWVKWCLLGIAVLCVCLVWLHTPGDHWNNTPNPQNQSEKPQQIKLHSGQFVNRVNRTRLPPYKPMELRSAGKYNTVNATFSCDSADAGGTLVSGNVYWTLFAGRRNRLALQVNIRPIHLSIHLTFYWSSPVFPKWMGNSVNSAYSGNLIIH